MGRTIKRVQLDFDWGLNKVWEGYKNPYQSIACDICDGDGYSSDAKAMKRLWYGWDNEIRAQNPFNKK